MKNFEIGIRKYVEGDFPEYWLAINAKIVQSKEEEEGEEIGTTDKLKILQRKFPRFPVYFSENPYWKIFIIFTILINLFITINFYTHYSRLYLEIIITVHLTCFVYWFDFIGFLTASVLRRKKIFNFRFIIFYLVIDAISLVPLSEMYLITESNPDVLTFWLLRGITLLRFYRVPLYISNLATAEKNHWKILVASYLFYFFIINDIIINIFLHNTRNMDLHIYDWRLTVENQLFTAMYFVLVTTLNIGYGDIAPIESLGVIVSIIALLSGFIIITGVVTGAIATEIANKEKRREKCRYVFGAILASLDKHKIDKKIIEKTSDNFLALWKYKKGYSVYPPIYFLPLSLRKEIFYDINIGLLNRSLIFSLQPKPFLRSLSLEIINQTFLPGDLIIEPYGLVHGCVMVSSGIIEILSEENDETPLISLTTGTVLGEISLFTSIPIRCVIKASTLVTLQLIHKISFVRLMLQYPYIYRSMRSQIYERLELARSVDLTEKPQFLNENVEEWARKKATKRIMRKLRKPLVAENARNFPKTEKETLLKLYVITEFIPKVKTLPMTLIRNKPWILRPNTVVTELWNVLIVLVAAVVAYTYPYVTAFVRILSNETYMMLKSVQIIYVVDIFVKCFTAVERKDNYTYITSLNEILKCNLKKPGFYLDVLAAFDLTVYSDLLIPNNVDFSYLLLSLNKLLKFYRITKYFAKLEDNLNINLFLIRGIKYLFYFTITIFWVAAVMYLEACPIQCLEDRWFEDEQIRESLNPTPCSAWPSIVSVYWATINVAGVGYGDINASSVWDCITVTVCIIMGATIVTYCTAQGSSTAKHTNRTKTIYQEEVFAVDRFMKDHGIPQDLQEKVRNYFKVQWDYDKGFEMRQNLAMEEMFFEQSDIMIPYLVKKFLTIPLFQDTPSDFLRALAQFSKTRILPPNEVIIYTGSFIKQIYIIEKGFCQVSMNEDQHYLIGPVKPIGYLEMILGFPIDVNMRTATHVRLISLDYQSYLRCVTTFPMVKAEIDSKIRYLRRRTPNLQETLKVALIFDATPYKITKSQEFLSRPFINVYRYHKETGTSYWTPFHYMKHFKIFRFILLPIVVTPHCMFLKVLVSLRIIKVVLIGLIAPVYFSLPHETSILGIIILILLIFTWIDMYLMFHIAYYNDKGLLVYHPAKTSMWYLRNNFFIDLITAFPYHLFLNAFFPKTEDKPSLTHDAPGLIMVLQYYKFYQAFNYLESDILNIIEHVKMLKYIPLSVIITNVITGFIILLECNEAIREPFHIYGSNSLEFEYHKSISVFCFPHNTTASEEERLYPMKFYFIAYYWVTSTMSQCGFGDITAHNRTTMLAVILMAILGLFLYGYMFAALTGSMISAYTFIAKYRKNVKDMLKFMKENGASSKIQKRLTIFYEFYWIRTEGAEPQKMLTYVHEALRLNILASVYDPTIKLVPAFKSAEKSMLSVIARCMEEVYFLRGEIIVKYNDIQEYIYLVHRGKVDIFSKDAVYITSMETGGLFGNVTRKPFARSSIVVICAKNIDALRFNASLFFQTLQFFPNTKGIIDYLMSLKKGYVEPVKETERVETLTPLFDDDKETLPYEITVLKTVRPSISLYDENDTLNANKTFLYFFNSIYRPPWKNRSNFIILHDSWFYYNIVRFYSAATTINGFLVPYMAILPTNYFTWIAAYALDVLFYARIWLNLHFSYFNAAGNYVVNLKLIRARYKKEKLLIFVDVFSNSPIEILAFLAGRDKALKYLVLLRLNRVLRFYYCYYYYKIRKKSLMINKIYVELLWIVVFMTLMVHFFACFWIFITRPLGKKQPTSWVTEMYLNHEDNWKMFSLAVYYVIGILTSTGFGDVKVVSGVELITAIFFMILCRFVVAMMAGSVAAAINVHSQSLFLYQERITELKEYFLQNNVSKYQIIKMWRYVTSLWLKESGKQIPKFIENAPHVMRCEVMTSMFGDHLSQCFAFFNTNEAFLRQLSTYLKRSVYFPGNYIAHQGDIDHTMYFIHAGQISVLTIHTNLMETIHYKLVHKDSFGLTQGLITGKPHHFTYRAETEAVILSLTLEDWRHLLKYFPEEESKIYDRLKHLPIQKDILTDNFDPF